MPALLFWRQWGGVRAGVLARGGARMGVTKGVMSSTSLQPGHLPAAA